MTLYIYVSVLFLCTVIGLYLLRGLSRALCFMWLYSVLSVIVEAIGWYKKLQDQQPHRNIFVIFQNFEYILICGFFLSILDHKRQRNLIKITLPIIVSINIAALMDTSTPSHLKHYSFLVESLLLTIWSVLYFFQLFQNIGDEKLEDNPYFWVSVGIIFFYCGSFFITGYANAISRYDAKLATLLYESINHLLNCVYYGMITYGFICQAKSRKLS